MTASGGGNSGAWKEPELEKEMTEICQIFIVHAIK
jgi:hypothetical protein